MVIVVGLDYFKFFLDLKIVLGGVEGEVFFVVFVGMLDDSKGGDGNKSFDGKY